MRPARADDLPAIVRLIAEDESGLHDESADPADRALYERAFGEIAGDARNELFVAEFSGSVAGTIQLTYMLHVFDRGAERVQLEGIFVANDMRGRGIGSAMIAFALERARARGCRIAQLNSNKARSDAHRFYERAGFVASHEGFKAEL
ncbi:MAG: GNAT family N-acetyltransferase [Hyphomicrobiales bacterium]